MIEELEDAVSRIPEGERGVFVDVGAHFGDWTVEAAAVFRSVVAVEPNPQSHAKIVGRIAGMHGRARAYQVALAAQDGEVDLLVDCPSTICTIDPGWRRDVFPHYFASDACVRVPAMTWATFIRTAGIHRVDLLKIDAEGSDRTIAMQVFEHAATHDILPRVVVVELTPRDRAAVLEASFAAGFREARTFTLDGARGYLNHVLVLGGDR